MRCEIKISSIEKHLPLCFAMKTKPKASYRVRNWREYDAALKQRGSLTVWIDEAVIAGWINEQKSGRRGASKHYSNGAIALMATVQSLFNLPGRQTEGFLESLFGLMGIDLPVPDHSTLSRRMGKVEVELPVAPSEGGIHVVVDSTGVKVYGEGEWKVRQHGVGKRRTWRKLHVGVNEANGEILAAVASTNNVSDDDALADILGGIDDEIEQVSGDGAYDKRKCYDEISARGAKATIPPRKDAVMWENTPESEDVHPRNQVLERIEEVGRQQWKQESGYHRRSLAETTMFRFKTIFGGTLRRRWFDNQAVELFLKCAALNRMIQLGKPDSYKVEN
jgi:IS5 family transposase